MRRFKSPGESLILAVFLSGTLGLSAPAQSRPAESAPQPPSEGQVAAANSTQQAAPDHLPDAPGQSAVAPAPGGSIYGTVIDPNGNVVAGARVTLEFEADKTQRTAFTDNTGFFRFWDLAAGTFQVTIMAKGFAEWAGTEIVLSPGRYYDVPDITLQIAPAKTNVEVVFTPHEMAEEQIKVQEQQRILGVIPNFYTSYVWHAVPLSSGQKFRLALRTSIDPVTFGLDAAAAGIEQWQNEFSGYGQGGEGYAKRFGASYADDVIDTMIGGAVLPSILHQDPRYFYKGTGPIPARALYAISTVIICRGDNGRRQPNYSNVVGNLMAAGISNLYYPAGNRDGAELTIENALISTGEGAVTALLQEFVLRKISRGVQHAPRAQP